MGFTDSLVSASVVTRGLTTSFPLCAVAMELSAQIEARGVELLLEWVPRQVNAEADRLADGDFQGLAPEMRVPAAFGQVRWLVLDRLMKAGLAFQREAESIQRRRREVTSGRRGGRLALRAEKRLKEKEPW